METIRLKFETILDPNGSEIFKDTGKIPPAPEGAVPVRIKVIFFVIQSVKFSIASFHQRACKIINPQELFPEGFYQEVPKLFSDLKWLLEFETDRRFRR